MAKKKKKPNKSVTKPISNKRFITEKARTLPLYKCYVSKAWEKQGMVYVIVARERSNANLCVGIYLCDTWCLGITKAHGAVNISKEDFKREIIDTMPDIKECDYTYAHNLVYGAEAFAADADIKPHPEFALWSHVLLEDTDEVPLIEMEFGDNGKYHLVAEKGSTEARYAPVLRERLGEDFICDIGYGKYVPDHGHDSNYHKKDDCKEKDKASYSGFEKLLTEATPDSMVDLIQRISDGLKKTQDEDRRHPDEIYSYQHPQYPCRLDIKHKFIAEEFRKPTNSLALPHKVIDRILALPKDEVVSDISNIIMYTIGKTWKAIDDDTLDWTNDYTIIHSLAFLTEIGDEAGFNAVMEIMRQDNTFREFHMGDSDGMILANAIYATGRNHPDILEEFLMHPGYEGFAKGFVSDALSFIAIEEPERRHEVIEIYRRYLNFMQENMPSQNGCSGYVAGTVMSGLMYLKATELLPEIKKLYDSGYVNLNMCGSYEDVEKHILSKTTTASGRYDFTDIKDLYARMQRAFRH